MRLRVAVGGVHHESNTFSPIVTQGEEFLLYKGEALLSLKGEKSSIGGVIDRLLEEKVEVVPLLYARAVPNGAVSKLFYRKFKEEFLTSVEEAGDVDAFVLALHGSMFVEEIGDAEGDLLEGLRALHSTTLTVSALDMHATVTEKMVDNCNAFVGYKCAPHTDTYETGVQAAEMALYSLTNNRPLRMGVCSIPMIIAGEKSETSVEPMRSLIGLLRQTERLDGVLAASYLLGFPWSDSRDNSVNALVVADSEQKAGELSLSLAKTFWESRHNFVFHTETYPPQEAFERFLQSSQLPVFLSDSGDNPTAGATGDATSLLRIVADHPKTRVLKEPILYNGLYDPGSTARCFEAGEGRRVKVSLGGKLDTRSGEPLEAEVLVKRTCREWGAHQTNLALVEWSGIELILTSKHIGFVTCEMPAALGIDVAKRERVVVKLGYLTDSFKRVAGHSLMALSKGCSYEVLEELPYREVKRPLFPLDRDFLPHFKSRLY